MNVSDIPISLYIHTPWCLHKCPYCDFNSHSLKEKIPEAAYISRLLKDFKEQKSYLQGRQIHSIFIGGGTPSLFSPESYKHLLYELHELADISTDAEITMEANPGAIEQTYFQGYRDAGINRLSIGIQSFQNEKLKVLQRIHDSDEAKNAILCAKKSGFDNLNIDLMFGLPKQSVENGLFDLKTALDLKPTHLSWYQLTLEPNTAFHHKPPHLPHDDTIWKLQLQGQNLLNEKGYKQYEVSAYSLKNSQCQHNRNYWLYGDYIGIGAGAHGKITDAHSQQIFRRWNHKNPKDYLDPNKTILGGKQSVKPEDRPLEFMMNALRLQEPIPNSLFEKRTGLQLQKLDTPLSRAEALGLLTRSTNNLSVTPQGQRYLNELLALF